jgi:hypothetical protein
MPETLWRLHEHSADLHTSRFSAVLNWRQPCDGLTDICLGNTRIPDAGLLGLKMPDEFLFQTGQSSDGYFRGADFIAAYEQSRISPGRIDAFWKIITPEPDDPFLAALDLIVSVSTYLPETRPDISVQSRLPSLDLMRLTNAEKAEFKPVQCKSGEAAVLAGEDGPGSVLFRLPEEEISYAEMVHPADFQSDELTRDKTADGVCSLRHRLFSVPLEKGVILRCRVRGAFFPRYDDLAAARACYRSFAAAEPSLDA